MYVNPKKLIPIEEILVKDRVCQTHGLKLKLLKLNIKAHVCECCGLTKWLDCKIPLELHHVNGDYYDNRIENIQLLCPNCHAQTDNYRGKNKRVAQGEILEVEDIKVGEGC